MHERRSGSSTAAPLLWRQAFGTELERAAIDQAWREVASGRRVLPAAPCRAAWHDGDDELRRLVHARFRSLPFEPAAGTARALLLRVGDDTELLLSAPAGALTPDSGSRAIAEVAAGYRRRASNRAPLPPVEPVVEVAAGGASPGAADRGDGAGAARRARDSLVPLRVAGRPHLHVFHPGGGGVLPYAPLVAALPADWTVTASDDVGSGDSVAGLVDTYLPPLLERFGVPDLLGGWSLGGLMAFETARRLSEPGGAGPPPLVLLDVTPPGGAEPMPSPGIMNLELAGVLWSTLGLSGHYPDELDAGGDDATAMSALQAALARAGETIEIDVLVDLLDVYRRHRRALTTYTSSARMDVPALVVAGRLEESVISRWRTWLPPASVITGLAGGHYDLLRPPRVATLGRLIALWWAERLHGAAGRAGGPPA